MKRSEEFVGVAIGLLTVLTLWFVVLGLVRGLT